MNTRAVATLFAAVLAFGAVVQVFLPLKARAQQHHHDFHKDFYRHWKPNDNPNTSCCNARIVGPDGVETGDCEPTKAEIRAGVWWVWVRQINGWIPVADAKILRERNPNGQDAHHCWTLDRGTICFVPPDTGG